MDERPCGLAAVRRAAELSAERCPPICVLYWQPPQSAHRGLHVPEARRDDAIVDDDVFARAAAVLAPFGRPWDFRLVPAGEPPLLNRHLVVRGLADLVVVAGHWKGHPFEAVRKAAAAYQAARLRTVAVAVVVVDCDRSATPPVRARARPR